LVVNTGAVSPFDNIVDWAKPEGAIRSEKLKIKIDKRLYFLNMANVLTY